MIKEGSKAPTFSLTSDSGDLVSLSDFAGKTLVLYFYPRDNTPGCTREAQAFSAARAAFAKAGAAVVGVSRDTVKSHCAFRDKYKLQIPLLADPDLDAHKAYGAWGEKTMYGKKVLGAIRSTFVIRDGKVVRVFPSVKVDGHADAVLEVVRGGGGASANAPVKAKAPAKAKAKTPAKAKAKASAKPAASKPAAKNDKKKSKAKA